MKAFLILVFFFGLTANLYGQDLQPLVFSGGKNFVGKDVIQLEYGLNFEKQINTINTTQQQLSQYALIKYGIRPDLDISVTYNYARELFFVSDQMRRSAGLGNLAVGFKKKLGANYSLQSNVGFSKNEIGKTLGNFQLFGISEHNIDSFLAWENNLGLSWENGNPEANLMYLSGITFTIPYPLDIILEFYGKYSPSVWNNYGSVGLGYYFNTDLMAEAYFGFGNTSDQEASFFSVNLYWRLVPARYYEE